MQDIQAAFQAEIEKVLKAQYFPADEIPSLFLSALETTLHFESIATMGCDMETFKRIHRPTTIGITLYDMGFILNAMERRTPFEYSRHNKFGYLECIEAARSMSDRWNVIVNPIKQSIMTKLKTQARISQGVPSGKKIIGQA